MGKQKYKIVSELLDETMREVSSSEENWCRFLTTSSRLYKYPFKEQVLIYAQRPDATACASVEIWNHRMNCWINRGSKGIALIDEDRYGKTDETAPFVERVCVIADRITEETGKQLFHDVEELKKGFLMKRMMNWNR